MTRTRVFVGASLDGFIAGPNDELDWLGVGEGEVPDTFAPFFAQIGAVLMGRRSYAVVCGFTTPWAYGETPILVPTRNPLAVERPTVRAVHGSIAELIAQAKQAAGDRDVYVDGGQLIRATLDAGLVDEITVTIVPMILGAGIPLFAGAERRHPLTLVSQRAIGQAVELTYRPRR
jgi:dihydrofolate reductase